MVYCLKSAFHYAAVEKDKFKSWKVYIYSYKIRKYVQPGEAWVGEKVVGMYRDALYSLWDV